MAVGDVVSQTGLVGFMFQPAATVQVLITQMIAQGSTVPSIYGRGDIDTTGFVSASNGATDTVQIKNWLNPVKWFVDNASYIYFYTTTPNSIGFSGIQTQ